MDLLFPQTLKDLPRITFMTDECITLHDFLIRIRQPYERFGLDVYVKGNSLIFRPGPAVVECRAYRINSDHIQHARTYDKFFDCHPFDPQWMAWIEKLSLLLYVNSVEKLDLFDEFIRQVRWTTGQNLLHNHLLLATSQKPRQRSDVG